MPYLWIYRIALGLLAVLALRNAVGFLQNQSPSGYPGLAFIVWALMIWAIAARPRKAGLWVGLILIAMVLLQTYLWSRVLQNSNIPLEVRSSDTWRHFVPTQVMQALAAIFCLLLRIRQDNKG
jgi:hypothetical protein